MITEEAQHVGGGSFRYSKPDMERKMKQNREKVWKHRAHIIWDNLFGKVFRKMMRDEDVKILLVLLSAVVWIGGWCFFSTWLMGDNPTLLLVLFPGVLSPLVIKCWLWPAFKNIKEDWNP